MNLISTLCNTYHLSTKKKKMLKKLKIKNKETHKIMNMMKQSIGIHGLCHAYKCT